MTHPTKIDNETWLLEEGDRIIHKEALQDYKSLSDVEKAVYCLWVIDYAVRNSGTLHPMRDLHETSIGELAAFAKKNQCDRLDSMLKLADNEEAFCNNYYQYFDDACNDLRGLYKNGKS